MNKQCYCMGETKDDGQYVVTHRKEYCVAMKDLPKFSSSPCPLTKSSHEKALVRVVEKRMQQLNEEGLYMGSTDIEYIQVLCSCGHIISEAEIKSK